MNSVHIMGTAIHRVPIHRVLKCRRHLSSRWAQGLCASQSWVPEREIDQPKVTQRVSSWTCLSGPIYFSLCHLEAFNIWYKPSGHMYTMPKTSTNVGRNCVVCVYVYLWMQWRWVEGFCSLIFKKLFGGYFDNIFWRLSPIRKQMAPKYCQTYRISGKSLT